MKTNIKLLIPSTLIALTVSSFYECHGAESNGRSQLTEDPSSARKNDGKTYISDGINEAINDENKYDEYGICKVKDFIKLFTEDDLKKIKKYSRDEPLSFDDF